MPAIPSMPGNARWRAALNQAHCLLVQTASEMQDYHDDRSEQWQEGPNADDLTERIEAIEDTAAQLQALADS